MAHKIKKAVTQSTEPGVWHDILSELRLLRRDLSLLLGQDNLADYENADQIKQLYRRAQKQHPPVSE